MRASAVRRAIILVAILLGTLAVWPARLARAADTDPADYLPSGVSIRQSISGDVDGDGRDDRIVLYTMQPSATALARASVLVLLATDDGVRPVHLFGEPPTHLRGEPALDPNGNADIELGDVTGDGRPEIHVRVRVQFQEPQPRAMLWIFGRGETPSPPNRSGPPPSPLAGTGFRLEAYLEGQALTMTLPAPLDPDRAMILRREWSERRLGGADPEVRGAETYRWQGGAFRLTERALTLPPTTGALARSPETAVLAFYEATARGDLETAVTLLSDDLRASRSAPVIPMPDAVRSRMRVEEIRTIDEHLSDRAGADADRLVYVRVSMVDPRIEPPPLPDPADWIDGVPPPEPPRTTIAGTWRTQREGDRWRLVAAHLHETANLDALSATLPPGLRIAQTAGADLRTSGVEDVVVLAASPGRFTLLEPYLIFGGANGPERSVPLASFVGVDGALGVVGGTVRAADVNGDDRPEIAFSAFVGAHGALLWVLQWDGATFVPLFAEASNSPGADLVDLDGDSVPEIVLAQSGYCGSYAASPQFTFAFRWEDGAYRPATARFPDLNEGLADRLDDLRSDSGHDDARACIQHMSSMAHALQDRPAEARTAYRAYSQARQRVANDQRSLVRPIYLSAEYVEAELHTRIAASATGQDAGWGGQERAVLHDLLGDALLDRARVADYRADDAAKQGNADGAREARRLASALRQQATRAYQEALNLDPDDEEARRALGS